MMVMLMDDLYVLAQPPHAHLALIKFINPTRAHLPPNLSASRLALLASNRMYPIFWDESLMAIG